MNDVPCRPSFHTLDDEGRFVPTKLAQSPWNPRAQNGLALAGLVAHLAERLPAIGAMTIARMTIDIVRATPMAPLHASNRTLREGRKQLLQEIELFSDGLLVTRASILRVRTAESPVFGQRNDAYPPPEEVPERSIFPKGLFGGWIETRMVCGDPQSAGPVSTWTKFGVDAVAGISASPFVHSAMLADIGNAIGAIRKEGWIFPNLDVDIHFTRIPQGPWLLTDSYSVSEGNGYGLAATIMADIHGPFASVRRILFIDAPKAAGAIPPLSRPVF